MRTIFHCDINNCFASIEMAREPNLRGKAIAVCGDPQSRRGIVLAKSEAAKRCGVATGDPLWMACQKCPSIVFVPPHFELYEAYSRELRERGYIRCLEGFRYNRGKVWLWRLFRRILRGNQQLQRRKHESLGFRW